MRQHPFLTIFVVSVGAAIILISLQLPLLYYSDEIVFHIAKIFGAQRGDYFTDPITGFKSIYPPLFHITMGIVNRFIGLDGFQLSRLLQVLVFAGLFGSGLYFCRVTCGDWEKGAFAALLIIFLVYAPTGKYYMVHLPSNFSFPFTLIGIALLLAYVETRKLKYAIAGAALSGFGIDMWWWNFIPVVSLILSMYLTDRYTRSVSKYRRDYLAILISLGTMLLYNLWVLYEIRDVLPKYLSGLPQNRDIVFQSLPELISNACLTFLLKGNQQFFKYLYPAAANTHSLVAMAYGLMASIYFYLLVLPANFSLLVFSLRLSYRKWRGHLSDMQLILLRAAVFTFLLSFLTVYQNGSVLRRVQFFVFILLLPPFAMMLLRSFRERHSNRWLYPIACVSAFSLIYSSVYRPELTLSDPITLETRAVVNFVNSLPDHSTKRIFITEFDDHRLARETSFRSFLLTGNPTYYWQDVASADSITKAYLEIATASPNAEFVLRQFNTEYAIIGKTPFNISPVPGKLTADTLTTKMLQLFGAVGKPLLDNSEWTVFQLTFPDEFATLSHGSGR